MPSGMLTEIQNAHRDAHRDPGWMQHMQQGQEQGNAVRGCSAVFFRQKKLTWKSSPLLQHEEAFTIFPLGMDMQILRLKLGFYASEGLGLLLGVKLHPVPPETSNEAKCF